MLASLVTPLTFPVAEIAEVFVTAEKAAAMMVTGAPAVLDARGAQAEAPYLPGAVVINWLKFRDGYFRTGRLDDDLEDVRQRLESLGVSSHRPVLVYGDMAEGWGDEGRIWWMLRYLGHPKVRIIDGGLAEWIRGGRPTVNRAASGHQNGDLKLALRSGLRVDWRQVNQLRHSSRVVILDVRTRAEYDGATPYRAARGGHIPGAIHLEWTELVDAHGRIERHATVRARMAALGITSDTTVVTYCTGGVRAAFVQAVLVDAGFGWVANYDGSWWEWASHDELPLQR